MPYPLDLYIDDVWDEFKDIGDQIATMHSRFDDLADMLDGGWLGSAAFVCRGIADCFTQIAYGFAGTTNSLRASLDDTLEYINDYVPWDAGAVTWQGIAEAWFADDFEGRAVTIACIDRMRQLIWDEPFKVVWAAEIEKQEL